jgi:hypothetical protein
MNCGNSNLINEIIDEATVTDQLEWRQFSLKKLKEDWKNKQSSVLTLCFMDHSLNLKMIVQ